MNILAAMILFIVGALLLFYGQARYPAKDPLVLARIQNCEDENSQKMRDDEIENRQSRATFTGASVGLWIVGFVLLAI